MRITATPPAIDTGTVDTVDTVVIGAGQAGLATSRCLTARGRDHIVLERGEIAHRWTTARWDSLRLLTPNWQTRLPGWRYAGDEPDGFMSMPEVDRFLRSYAASFDAPVHSGVDVTSVTRCDRGYHVDTDAGRYRCTNVIVATGAAARPWQPFDTTAASASIEQISPTDYRNPRGLADGGVLIVGASASGVQIADELAHHGRPVTLAVGRHNRIPRRYRHEDIMWWLDRIGHFDAVLDPGHTAHGDGRARQTSLQLIGSASRRDIGLCSLQSAGVRLTGRLVGLDATRATFADDLATSAADAERRLSTLLATIDEHIDPGSVSRSGTSRRLGRRFEQLVVRRTPTRLDLARERIGTIIWATGFRPDLSWLQVPVLTADGKLIHRHGITAAAGLYAVGMPRQRTRKSTFIDGVGDDAAFVVDHLVGAEPTRSTLAMAVGS